MSVRPGSWAEKWFIALASPGAVSSDDDRHAREPLALMRARFTDAYSVAVLDTLGSRTLEFDRPGSREDEI